MRRTPGSRPPSTTPSRASADSSPSPSSPPPRGSPHHRRRRSATAHANAIAAAVCAAGGLLAAVTIRNPPRAGESRSTPVDAVPLRCPAAPAACSPSRSTLSDSPRIPTRTERSSVGTERAPILACTLDRAPRTHRRSQVSHKPPHPPAAGGVEVAARRTAQRAGGLGDEAAHSGWSRSRQRCPHGPAGRREVTPLDAAIQDGFSPRGCGPGPSVNPTKSGARAGARRRGRRAQAPNRCWSKGSLVLEGAPAAPSL